MEQHGTWKIEDVLEKIFLGVYLSPTHNHLKTREVINSGYKVFCYGVIKTAHSTLIWQLLTHMEKNIVFVNTLFFN